MKISALNANEHASRQAAVSALTLIALLLFAMLTTGCGSDLVAPDLADADANGEVSAEREEQRERRLPDLHDPQEQVGKTQGLVLNITGIPDESTSTARR